jgi:hypothetical protein
MNTLKAKKFIVGFVVSALSLLTIDGFLYLISDGSFHVKIGGSIIGGAIMGGIMNTQNNCFIKCCKSNEKRNSC